MEDLPSAALAFATDLTRQQEARETAKHKAECEPQERAARRRGPAAAGGGCRCRPAARTPGRRAERAQRLTAFWHYFKRRRLQKSLEALRQGVVAADAAVGELHAERSAIGNEALEEFPGISLAARRNINLAIISYAESLCEHVDAYGLAARAKEAVARRVHEMSFGTRADCEGYMQRVQKAQAAVANQKQITAGVRAKLERLRGTCEYRNYRRYRADGGLARGAATAAPAELERARRGLLGPV